MRRRQFITFFGAAFTLPTLSPLSVRAQQTARPLVGLIFSGTVAAFADRTSAFRKGLSEMGYVDGDNVTVEYHGLDGDYDHLPPLLDDLIRRRVAVIATPGSNPAALAAKAATATIPVVFGVAEDPVTMGLVTSLAHPGGNATGINFFAHETDAKRLGLMHELVPAASRFAVLMNPINVYGAQLISKDLNEAASALGLTVVFSMPAMQRRSTRPSQQLRARSAMRFSSWAMVSLPVARRSLRPSQRATGFLRAISHAV
jgi:putative tryptophan/tyrosine transport system substrate-binding protein